MGACCPKLLAKSQSRQSVRSDDPLIHGSSDLRASNLQIPNGPSDSISKESDERAIYNKIIDDTQSQIIDVMSLDQRGGNVSELVDRASLYQSKLQSLSTDSSVASRKDQYEARVPKLTLVSETDPQMTPITAQEITFMNEILTQFEQALGEISVKQVEALVTPLSI